MWFGFGFKLLTFWFELLRHETQEWIFGCDCVIEFGYDVYRLLKGSFGVLN